MLKIYLISRDGKWGRKSLPTKKHMNTQSSRQRWVKEHNNELILSVTKLWWAVFNSVLKVTREFFGFALPRFVIGPENLRTFV